MRRKENQTADTETSSGLLALCGSPAVQARAVKETPEPSDSGRFVRHAPRVQSRRDCIRQPRVAKHELPWEIKAMNHNPNGVATYPNGHDTTPLGLQTVSRNTQGCSSRATLGLSGIPLGFNSEIPE